MDKKNILSHVDHTLLSQTAAWAEIKKLCDEGMAAQVASVCIAPAYVKDVVSYLAGKLSVCTVIGFPNGYNTSYIKLKEAEEALLNGADELDMVINLGWLKDNKKGLLLDEISSIKKLCEEKVLKVIIETCFLTEDEKTAMCRIVSESGADFIKTSTGFGKNGADLQDIYLFKRNITENLRIKAAGGIRTFEEARAFLEAGASRIGSSALAKG